MDRRVPSGRGSSRRGSSRRVFSRRVSMRNSAGRSVVTESTPWPLACRGRRLLRGRGLLVAVLRGHLAVVLCPPPAQSWSAPLLALPTLARCRCGCGVGAASSPAPWPTDFVTRPASRSIAYSPLCGGISPAAATPSLQDCCKRLLVTASDCADNTQRTRRPESHTRAGPAARNAGH